MSRTSDPLVPNQLRYQAALRPEERNNTHLPPGGQSSFTSFFISLATNDDFHSGNACKTFAGDSFRHVTRIFFVFGFDHDPD